MTLLCVTRRITCAGMNFSLCVFLCPCPHVCLCVSVSVHEFVREFVRECICV